MSAAAQQEIGRHRVERLLAEFGCIPPAPDGPLLKTWDKRALAEAILSEIRRAKQFGWTKITLHMDLRDAKRLAEALR